MMKKMVAGLMLAVAVATAAEGREWYEGGTLHRGTVAEWKAASERNRLATSADFAAITWAARRAMLMNELELVRLQAEAIKACIDVAAVDDSFSHYDVAQLGAACIGLLGLNE